MFVLGDIHGQPELLRQWLEQLPKLDKNKTYSVVCLGDTSIRYGDCEYGWAVKDIMKSQTNLSWYVMRGDCDDRYYRYAEEHQDKYSVHKFSRFAAEHGYENILYLPDNGHIRSVDQDLCLFIPGASSPDKWDKIEAGFSADSNTQLTSEEMAALESELEAFPKRIKYVFSHTCPMSWIDKLDRDSYMQRADLDRAMEKWLEDKILPFVKKNNPDYKWFCGHGHEDLQIDEHSVMVYRKNVQA